MCGLRRRTLACPAAKRIGPLAHYDGSTVPDVLPKLVYHPLLTFAAASIVAMLLAALFARGGKQGWLPPLAIGIAALVEATAGLWAVERIFTRFRSLPV